MFNIPNAADAEDASQAQIDSRDFGDIIVAALSGTGVVSGCAVTAQGSPNMTVAVAAGTVAVAGVSVAVTGGNVTITTANATNPRFDLICVDNTGAKSAVAGTPAANPTFPSPAGKVVLAAVRVPAGAASINGPKITDKRCPPVVVPQAIPTGMYAPFSGSVAPTGWLLCDGSAVSRTTYSTLFSLIGTQHGAGDGSTTFNVPDFRGRVPVGVGTHADVNALAMSDGLPVATRSIKHNMTNALTLPNHGHSDTISFSDTGHSHGITDNGHQHRTAGASTVVGTSVSFSGGGGGGQGNVNSSTDLFNVNTDVRGTGIGINAGSAALSKGGSVGNPTSLPAIGGSIGPSGARPLDGPAFLTCNWLIKT